MTPSPVTAAALRAYLERRRGRWVVDVGDDDDEDDLDETTDARSE